MLIIYQICQMLVRGGGVFSWLQPPKPPAFGFIFFAILFMLCYAQYATSEIQNLLKLHNNLSIILCFVDCSSVQISLLSADNDKISRLGGNDWTKPHAKVKTHETEREKVLAVNSVCRKERIKRQKIRTGYGWLSFWGIHSRSAPTQTASQVLHQ